MPRCPFCGRIGADVVKALEMIQSHQCRVVSATHITGDRDSER